MKNKKFWMIIIITIAILSGLFLYLKSTPQYSLFRMYWSVKQRDYTTFSKFVDIDSVVNNLVDKVIENEKQQNLNNSTDEWASLGNSFAEGLITLMKPTLTSEIKSGIQKGVESGDFDTKYQPKEMIGILRNIKVKRDGKVATVTINNKDNKPFNFKMRKLNGYWQVFSTDIDLSSIKTN